MASDPFEIVDPILMAWANEHGVHVATKDRDWVCRSVWVFDSSGKKRVQLWLDLPKGDAVTVCLAELDLSRPSNWGRRMDRTVKITELKGAIEEFRSTAFAWAGPGAFA